MRVLGRAVAIASVLAVSACGGPTPYQPLGQEGRGDGGWQQQQIATDRFRVSFAGNSLTDRDTVENYLLFRAAELALEQGSAHFVIIEKDIERSTRYIETFDQPWPRAHTRRGRHSPFWDYGEPITATVSPLHVYRGTLTIALRPELGADTNQYDAADVMNRLRDRIVRPQMRRAG